MGQTLMHWPHWMQTESSILRQVGGRDDGVEPAAVLAEVVDALDLRADPHAAAAEDALLAVADDRVAGEVQGEPFPPALEVPRADAHRVGQVLQLAVAVALAGLAIHGVIVQQQLDDVAAGLADFGRVGLHLHPFPDLDAARGHVVAHVLDVHDADAAGAGQAQVGMVAEPGDADAQLLGRLHDRRALGDRDCVAVDGQGYSSSCIRIAPHRSRMGEQGDRRSTQRLRLRVAIRKRASTRPAVASFILHPSSFPYIPAPSPRRTGRPRNTCRT